MCIFDYLYEVSDGEVVRHSGILIVVLYCIAIAMHSIVLHSSCTESDSQCF